MGEQDTERQARFLLSRSRETLVELDRAGVVTFASPGVTGLLGYEPSALAGRVWADLVLSQYRDDVRGSLERDTTGLRYFVLNAAGIAVFVEEDGAWDESAHRRGMVLRLGPGEGLERLKDLVDNLPEAVLYQTAQFPDGNLRFTYVSPGVRDLLGHEAEAWLRDPMVAYRTVHEDDNDGFFMLSGQLKGTPKTFDYVSRHRTTWGETKWVRMCARERVGRDGIFLWDGFLTDVTEDEVARGSTFGHPGFAAHADPGPRRHTADAESTRTTSDEAYLDQRLRLSQAIEQSDEAVVMADTRGIIVYANPGTGRLLFKDRIQAIGRSVTVLTCDRNPTTLYEEIVATVTGGGIWRGVLSCRHVDGSYIDVEGTVSPIRDTRGQVLNYLAVFHDVTERLALEGRLRQAQKLESIGTLAGGIAHDFNNVLMAINGFAALARDQLGDEGIGARSLGRIEVATRRATDLVQQILTFSRGVEGERRPLLLAPVVKETLKLLKATLPSTITMHQSVDESLVAAADPTHVHQMVMNLCTNAYHAMRERGGTLDVRLAPATAATLEGAGLPSGDFLELAVTDTGCGIPDDVRTRMFEPYYTTRAQGEGTGLGLAIVHGLAKSYSGAVTVESRVGQGSTLKVLLPRAAQGPLSGATLATESPLRGHERLLVVDDEALLVEYEQEALQGLGYRVTVASDPRLALEMVRRDPSAFDLVVTDQTMPHMTGVELMVELWRLRPNLPGLLCTGYSEQVDEVRALEAGFRAFLRKPFDHRLLAGAIRRCLGD